ncbi:MAG TPA: restriction endonuclease [Acidimicrobiales bacterium]|nr:restriction endonuclease [Acidimicrobiales bacterium]
MAISANTIKAHMAAIAKAANTSEQGRAHEDLAVHLFESVPGCRVERNIMNDFQTEEVDVAVGNDGLPAGLPGLANVILVECKDWSHPVSSQAVGYFINKLANRSVELGILIATNGIAGQKEHRNAVALGIGAIARGIKLLVITNDDIMALSSTADFVDLVKRRYLRAVAAGTVGLP